MIKTKKDLKDLDPLCFTKITRFENQLRKGKAKSCKGKKKRDVRECQCEPGCGGHWK
jgi:hypothetical protein